MNHWGKPIATQNPQSSAPNTAPAIRQMADSKIYSMRMAAWPEMWLMWLACRGPRIHRPDWARLGPTRPMAWRSVYGPPCLQRMCLSKSPPTQSSRTFHSAQMHMLKSLDGSWQPRNVYVGGWSGLYNISHHLAINHLQACRIYFSCPSRPAGSRDPDQVEVWFVLKSLVQHQHIWVVCPDKPRKNMAGTSFLAESLNCHWSNLWAALKDTQVVWTLCATWSCYQSYKYHCHYCCYSCCS